MDTSSFSVECTIHQKYLTCEADIDRWLSILETGDIVFFTTDKYHSIISFLIHVSCNSDWTHCGMVVRKTCCAKRRRIIQKDQNSPNGLSIKAVIPTSHSAIDDVYLWESVNNHSPTSIFLDARFNGTNKVKATGSGVRLINFKQFLMYSLECITKSKQVQISSYETSRSCQFGTLFLDSNCPRSMELQTKICEYVFGPSRMTRMIYPTTIWPLFYSWWDGIESLFVCCGCYSTYEAEMANLDPSSQTVHPHCIKGRKEEEEQEVFCSQLVIKTLEHTGLFSSLIPCEEWTPEDLTRSSNINQWFCAGVCYCGTTVYFALGCK